ncbi:MAG: hypothetical protein KatS3mg028_0295 [Bacteroidia bacterium]|nr:MAG: hypothetical protein KatS3mg028_0295 [Bacteroidia bacterium]
MMRNRLIIIILIFTSWFNGLKSQKKKFFTKDTVHHFFVSADVKSTPADRSVSSFDKDYKLSGQAIFDGYYKNDWLTDISIETFFKFKKGILLGARMQYYPATVFGKKVNYFFLIGYSFKTREKIYFNLRMGLTRRNLTFYENKKIGRVSYVGEPKDTVINGVIYVEYPIITRDLIYVELRDLYLDGQIMYFIKKHVGININFSLLREVGLSNIHIPRRGVGMGSVTYDYTLYIKSIGVGITFKF